MPAVSVGWGLSTRGPSYSHDYAQRPAGHKRISKLDKSAHPNMSIFMEKTAEILKALSDPTRLRILSLLRHGELCVCDLTEALQIPQSTVSRHLASLKNAAWVKARRSGKWMHYCLQNTNSSLQTRIVDTLKAELPAHIACQEDDRRYFTYLAVKPSHTCD